MHNPDHETAVKEFVDNLLEQSALCVTPGCSVMVYLSEMDMACPGCGDIGITKAMMEIKAALKP